MDTSVMDSFIARTTDVEGQGTEVCGDARKRRAEAAANFRRYDNLVYALSAATAIALIIAIGLIVVGRPSEGITTGVAGVVAGGATLFLLSRKNDALKQEKSAWADVKRECRAVVKEQDEAARLALGVTEDS